MSTLQIRVSGTKEDVHACLEQLEKRHPFTRLYFQVLGTCYYFDLSFESEVSCEEVEEFLKTQNKVRNCGTSKKCCV